MSTKPKKVSIVMSYVNRRNQLEFTLQTILLSKHKNIEIIVNDDGSDENEQIDDFVEKYGIFLIKVDIKNKKCINPVIGYNRAIMKATGDIIILQNPEVCYVNDVVYYVANNVDDTNYISFSCLALNDFAMNHQLTNILKKDSKISYNTLSKIFNDNLRWYNHPVIAPKHFHFCSAITRNNIYRMRGFSVEYQNGYCFDDDDLVLKIKYDLKLKMTIIPPDEYYVIHQYHKPSTSTNCTILPSSNPIRIAWEKNRDILDSKLKMKMNLSKSLSNQIPHIFNCYWDKSPMSYMAYLTVASFVYYNPSWLIHVYVSSHPAGINNRFKQQINNVKKDFWEDLIKLPNIKVVTIDFETIGFRNDIAEAFKSDYLKWHLLGTVGGIWSDFDILYINSIENAVLEKNPNFDTLIFVSDVNGDCYYPTGFFMSKPQNDFFIKLKNISKTFLNLAIHQSIGPDMIKKIWPKHTDILKEFPHLHFLVEDKYVYLPYEWWQLNKIFVDNSTENLQPKTVGIYWFRGSNDAVIFQNNFESRLLKNCTISNLINKFTQLLKNDSICENMKTLNPHYI